MIDKLAHADEIYSLVTSSHEPSIHRCGIHRCHRVGASLCFDDQRSSFETASTHENSMRCIECISSHGYLFCWVCICYCCCCILVLSSGMDGTGTLMRSVYFTLLSRFFHVNGQKKKIQNKKKEPLEFKQQHIPTVQSDRRSIQQQPTTTTTTTTN